MSVLKKELVLVGMEAASAEEAMRALAKAMLAEGLVRESFVEAVLEREKTYPTGIPAKVFDIALPHTMAEHVIEPCMAVGVLKEPVEFRQMGTPDIILHPRLIFMLAISDPKEQIGQLKKIMKLLQNDALLLGIRDADNAERVVELLTPALEN